MSQLKKKDRDLQRQNKASTLVTATLFSNVVSEATTVVKKF